MHAKMAEVFVLQLNKRNRGLLSTVDESAGEAHGKFAMPQ